MSLVKRLWYNENMKKLQREGFTLIELTLSLVFVSILSLAMIFVIADSVVSYRRGNTLGQVNTIGMSLVDNMRAAIQESSAKTLTSSCVVAFSDENERKRCEEDNAYAFVEVLKYSEVTLFNGRENVGRVPIYGAFCTGTYSYIWNSGYYELDGASFAERTSGKWVQIKSKDSNVLNSEQDSRKPFRLVRVKDENRAICMAAYDEGSRSKYKASEPFSTTNVLDITNIGDGEFDENPTYLLSSDGASNLALYDLTVARPAVSVENNSTLYSLSFILGTIDGGINISSQNNACAAPNDYESNFDYCAINKFSFAARATGE